MKKILTVLSLGIALSLPSVTFASSSSVEMEKVDWSFNNIREGWDKNTLYRGYQVATQVCLSCHNFKYISHRNLMKVGFSEAEVKTLAKALDMKVTDKIMSPMTDADAKESYGKALPDLSLIVRARHDGANYVYNILTGYHEAPLGHAQPEGTYYNTVFPGHNIAMPPPLSGGLVEYHDGTEANVSQMSKDVVYFLAWASEPEKKDRERLGVFVMLYIIIFTILAILTKKKVWSRLK